MLPDGWAPARDASSGEPYFNRPDANAAQWEQPGKLGGGEPGEEGPVPHMLLSPHKAPRLEPRPARPAAAEGVRGSLVRHRRPLLALALLLAVGAAVCSSLDVLSARRELRSCRALAALPTDGGIARACGAEPAGVPGGTRLCGLGLIGYTRYVLAVVGARSLEGARAFEFAAALVIAAAQWLCVLALGCGLLLQHGGRLRGSVRAVRLCCGLLLLAPLLLLALRPPGPPPPPIAHTTGPHPSTPSAAAAASLSGWSGVGSSLGGEYAAEFGAAVLALAAQQQQQAPPGGAEGGGEAHRASGRHARAEPEPSPPPPPPFVHHQQLGRASAPAARAARPAAPSALLPPELLAAGYTPNPRLAVEVLPQCELFRVDAAADLFSFYGKFSMLCGGGADFEERLVKDGLSDERAPRAAAAASPPEVPPPYVRSRGVVEPAAMCADSPGWDSAAGPTAEAAAADRAEAERAAASSRAQADAARRGRRPNAPEPRAPGAAAEVLTCGDYAARGLCADGHLIAVFQQEAGGPRHNSPEAHCCACGKAAHEAAAASSAASAASAAEKSGSSGGGSSGSRAADLAFPQPGEPAFDALPPAEQACSRAHALRRMGERAAAAEELLRACDIFFARPSERTRLGSARDAAGGGAPGGGATPALEKAAAAQAAEEGRGRGARARGARGADVGARGGGGGGGRLQGGALLASAEAPPASAVAELLVHEQPPERPAPADAPGSGGAAPAPAPAAGRLQAALARSASLLLQAAAQGGAERAEAARSPQLLLHAHLPTALALPAGLLLGAGVGKAVLPRLRLSWLLPALLLPAAHIPLGACLRAIGVRLVAGAGGVEPPAAPRWLPAAAALAVCALALAAAAVGAAATPPSSAARAHRALRLGACHALGCATLAGGGAVALAWAQAAEGGAWAEAASCLLSLGLCAGSQLLLLLVGSSDLLLEEAAAAQPAPPDARGDEGGAAAAAHEARLRELRGLLRGERAGARAEEEEGEGSEAEAEAASLARALQVQHGSALGKAKGALQL